MNWQIIKENETGKEVWRYEGKLLARTQHAVLMDARFNRDDFDFNGMALCRGDRFLEAYDDTRWFNIYEIYQGETDKLKGWYCNVTYPAVLHEGELHYRDLALDVLIFADRRHLILDEDEFGLLNLSPEIKEKARKIPQELLSLFERHQYQPIADWFDSL